MQWVIIAISYENKNGAVLMKITAREARLQKTCSIEIDNARKQIRTYLFYKRFSREISKKNNRFSIILKVSDRHNLLKTHKSLFEIRNFLLNSHNLSDRFKKEEIKRNLHREKEIFTIKNRR